MSTFFGSLSGLEIEREGERLVDHFDHGTNEIVYRVVRVENDMIASTILKPCMVKQDYPKVVVVVVVGGVKDVYVALQLALESSERGY